MSRISNSTHFCDSIYNSLGCVWAPSSPVTNVYSGSFLPVLGERGAHVTLQTLDGSDHQIVHWNTSNNMSQLVSKEFKKCQPVQIFFFNLFFKSYLWLSQSSVWNFVPLWEVWLLHCLYHSQKRMRRGGKLCPPVLVEYLPGQHVHSGPPVNKIYNYDQIPQIKPSAKYAFSFNSKC